MCNQGLPTLYVSLVSLKMVSITFRLLYAFDLPQSHQNITKTELYIQEENNGVEPSPNKRWVGVQSLLRTTASYFP